MPAGDQTGPTGMGPRTGRAAGYCSGSDVPGFANVTDCLGRRGRGSGGRGRRGNRRRNRFSAAGPMGVERVSRSRSTDEVAPVPPPSSISDDELETLDEQLVAAEASIEKLQHRIDGLKRRIRNTTAQSRSDEI